MDNKVLILSLGAARGYGNIDIRELNKEMDEDCKNRMCRAYQKANYSYVNDKGQFMICKNTPFVAEHLIDITEPDRVVVLGSIRSAWSGFYMKFVKTPSPAGYKELYNYEKGEKYKLNGEELVEGGRPEQEQCGIDTGGAELDAYEERINEIFHEADGIRSGAKGITPEIQIILIRYGIDELQQLENYSRFKKITNSLELGSRNLVSFDTTHSFRSIPLYNLALLNYIETVEDYDIEIAHVFNGCFDAQFENKVESDGKKINTAPILDLHGVIDLLAQTDAIKEFINTGNAVALTSDGSGRDNEFLSDLKLFDWATQINDYMTIEEAIVRLAGHETGMEGDTADQSSALIDRTRMILSVIRRKMLGGRPLKEFRTLSAAERRLLISEWYWKQNRYGQAIATAIEAMRSMVVPYYLESRGGTGSGAKVKEEDEVSRRSAESKLVSLKEYLEKSENSPVKEGSLEKAIIDVAESFMAARVVRNTFAHNLKTETKEVTGADDLTEKDSKEIIDEFLVNLRTFYEKINSDKERFKELYNTRISSEKHRKDLGDRISGAVIIFNFAKGQIEEILNAVPQNYRNKKKYLAPEAFTTTKSLKHEYAKAAAINLDILFYVKNTTVILYTTSMKHVSCMIPMLKAYSVQNVIALVKGDQNQYDRMLIPKDFYDVYYLNYIKDVHISPAVEACSQYDLSQYTEI